MLTEITIKIITAQDPEKAEQEIREAIGSMGYDISEAIQGDISEAEAG